MANFENGRLNVEQYETRAKETDGIAASGSDWYVRQAAGDSAMDVLQLCSEVRRLQVIQDRLSKLEYQIGMTIARNRKILETLRADYLSAMGADREMAANSISEHIGRVSMETAVLEALLNGAQ